MKVCLRPIAFQKEICIKYLFMMYHIALIQNGLRSFWMFNKCFLLCFDRDGQKRRVLVFKVSWNFSTRLTLSESLEIDSTHSIFVSKMVLSKMANISKKMNGSHNPIFLWYGLIRHEVAMFCLKMCKKSIKYYNMLLQLPMVK